MRNRLDLLGRQNGDGAYRVDQEPALWETGVPEGTPTRTVIEEGNSINKKSAPVSRVALARP
jgi:hypothetical protein